MSAWILPCLIKSQLPISAEDRDNTPLTTNTGEAQHNWTNLQTGVKLPRVEAIERYEINNSYLVPLLIAYNAR
jgi:hypothetical protein